MARMQGKTTTETYDCFAGVDVSKAHLDLRVAGANRGVRFANDAAGIAALAARLGDGPHLVVIEPTGRYHLNLWRGLVKAGHGVALVNPYAARKLAEGLGYLAKTDALDAKMLCELAWRLKPRTSAPPDDITLEIKELYAARRALIRRRAMARTQVCDNTNPIVAQLLTEEITLHGALIKRLEAALHDLIATCPKRKRQQEILTSIPGIGIGAALAILAGLPEIGDVTSRQIAALGATAPMNQESGKWIGKSRTKGGRRALRSALHMPAIVAMTHNKHLKAFADRLRARGKHISLVITAVLRKLLVLANTLVTQNRKWKPQSP